MSRPLSLFTVYKSDENAVTNYCGLLLRLLYEESKDAFETAIESITNAQLVVGPVFRQQEERRKVKSQNGDKSKSTPDLTITQMPFSVIVETKLGSSFDSVQFESHLEPRPVGKVVLILLGKGDSVDISQKYRGDIERLRERDILLTPLTFDEFVEHLELQSPSERYSVWVQEFRGFLNEQQLLPSWRHRLDVVNCYRTLDIVRKTQGYICPAEGGQYLHHRAKYFGAYKHKRVQVIYRIDALYEVAASIDGPVGDPVTSVSHHRCRWQLEDINEEDVVDRVDRVVREWFAGQTDRGGERTLQVFILSQPSLCDFRKVSRYGLRRNNMSFDLKEFVEETTLPDNVADVAELLSQRTWE